MRFVMFMIPAVYQKAESQKVDHVPTADGVERMMKYNEALANAGALISLDGLHSPADGARVSYRSGKVTVTDGPFAESKEVIGGYWMINVSSRAEAIEWAKKVPADDGDIVEVRQVFEMEDFPDDVQKAADNAAVNAAVEKHARKSS